MTPDKPEAVAIVHQTPHGSGLSFPNVDALKALPDGTPLYSAPREEQPAPPPTHPYPGSPEPATPPAAQGSEGAAWVIERYGHSNGPRYWAVFGHPSYFSDDPADAVRFARKADADSVLRTLDAPDRLGCQVAEHMWCDGPAPSADQSGEAEEAAKLCELIAADSFYGPIDADCVRRLRLAARALRRDAGVGVTDEMVDAAANTLALPVYWGTGKQLDRELVRAALVAALSAKGVGP